MNVLFVLFVAVGIGFASLLLWGATAGVVGLVVGGLVAAFGVANDLRRSRR